MLQWTQHCILKEALCHDLTCPKYSITVFVFSSCDVLSNKSSGRTRISSSWRPWRSWGINEEVLNVMQCNVLWKNVITVLYYAALRVYVKVLNISTKSSHPNSNVSPCLTHPHVEQTGWDVTHTLLAGRPAPLQYHWKLQWPKPPALSASSLVYEKTQMSTFYVTYWVWEYSNKNFTGVSLCRLNHHFFFGSSLCSFNRTQKI